jgi:hypothetical protein
MNLSGISDSLYPPSSLLPLEAGAPSSGRIDVVGVRGGRALNAHIRCEL